MPNFTAEESKAQYIQEMGEPLGSIFNALWQEVAWLHKVWSEYVELYATKESRVELLNKVAPSFFFIIQEGLWEQTLLHIARLTDPVKSAGKQNLTIQRLPSLVSDVRAAANISSLVNQAVSDAEFCRDWRNRHLAHRDLDLALEKSATPLSTANRQMVMTVMASIAKVLNAVSIHYMKTDIAFHIGDPVDGALSLLHVLSDGLKANEERRARLELGETRPDDFGPSDI